MCRDVINIRRLMQVIHTRKNLNKESVERFSIKVVLFKMNSSSSVVQSLTRTNFFRSYSDVFKMLFGKFLVNSYGCDSRAN
jgi:hypothetical protein